jgi:HPt (histidine-containing phosphotransfer) domain-containing protein
MEARFRHAPATAVVTLDALHACIGDDPGRVRKILGLLRCSLPSEVERLERATRETDVATAHRSAHSIKSNAALIGAARLCAKAGELEDYGRATNLDAIGRELDVLRALVLEVTAALDRQLTLSVDDTQKSGG